MQIKVYKILIYNCPVKLFGELMTLYCTMLLQVVKPTTFSTWSAVLAFDFEKTSNYLPQSAVYFGVEVHLFLGELKMEEMQANNIKEHCHSYILELLKQMHKRLSQNVKQSHSLTSAHQ